MNSDLQAHVMSDEELALVAGGGLVELNIAVVPQTAVANKTIIITPFSTVSHSNFGNTDASTWLTIKQLNK